MKTSTLADVAGRRFSSASEAGLIYSPIAGLCAAALGIYMGYEAAKFTKIYMAEIKLSETRTEATIKDGKYDLYPTDFPIVYPPAHQST